MYKRFLIVTKGATGAIELHPMKPWLRQHPEELPSGMTAEHRNSHSLRDALKRKGWTVNETEEEVRLLKPEIAEDINTVSVLGETPANGALDAEEEFAFSLESHLRDFIAHNLATLPIAQNRLRIYADSAR